MRVVVLGSNGLLGQALINSIPKGIEVHCIARGETKSVTVDNYYSADLTDFKLVKNLIQEISPSAIINAASYTHVDACETDPQSHVINVELLTLLTDIKVPIVHISTDYVFDGLNGPYSEDEMTNPISEYGRQKAASENIVLEHPQNSVLRTSWVYGKGIGLKMNYHDFVKSSLEQNKRIRIVDDQIGNPTFAPHLALMIWSLLEQKQAGLFHASGYSTVSRLEWAYQIADHYGLSKENIEVIKTQDLGQPAPRPENAGFKLDKIQKIIPQVNTFTLEQQIHSYETYQYAK